MMNLKMKRIFACVLAIVLALTVVAPALSLAVNAQYDFSEEKSQIADLNEKYKELQAQQNAIQAQINQAKNEKEKQEILKKQLDGQISTTVSQIGLLNERIDLLEKNILQKQDEMNEKQDEINQNFDLYKKRMRAMYMNQSNGSSLGMVLGAESYSQMLMRAEMVSRVTAHDQELLETLTREKQVLQEIKEEIESDKKSVEADKGELDQKREDLSVQVSQAQERIQTLANTEAAFLADKENLQKQMKQVQAEISAIYAEINKQSSKIPYVGGVMQWPSPSLTQVSSGFGGRFGGADFHTGIDITGSGAYGSPVLASNAGTVAVANTRHTPGYGYGIYVIIDHGGGIQTLYAHCSKLNVKVGDVVTTGQKIAEVGSTGWSTGPHIHFEVRKDGKAQNPVGWLQG